MTCWNCCSNIETMMNFMKGMLGSGILAIPAALKYSGIWVRMDVGQLWIYINYRMSSGSCTAHDDVVSLPTISLACYKLTIYCYFGRHHCWVSWTKSITTFKTHRHPTHLVHFRCIHNKLATIWIMSLLDELWPFLTTALHTLICVRIGSKYIFWDQIHCFSRL